MWTLRSRSPRPWPSCLQTRRTALITHGAVVDATSSTKQGQGMPSPRTPFLDLEDPSSTQQRPLDGPSHQGRYGDSRWRLVGIRRARRGRYDYLRALVGVVEGWLLLLSSSQQHLLFISHSYHPVFHQDPVFHPLDDEITSPRDIHCPSRSLHRAAHHDGEHRSCGALLPSSVLHTWPTSCAPVHNSHASLLSSCTRST